MWDSVVPTLLQTELLLCGCECGTGYPVAAGVVTVCVVVNFGQDTLLHTGWLLCGCKCGTLQTELLQCGCEYGTVIPCCRRSGYYVAVTREGKPKVCRWSVCD